MTMARKAAALAGAAVLTVSAPAATQSAVASPPAETPLLFRATFDGYNTAPEVAADKAKKPRGIDPDLQLRMDSGEPGMGNVLSLTSPEFVSYPMKGNFRPDRGTVSFWVRPCNYVISDTKTFQMFFSATASEFEFYIYKYTQRPNKILFYLRSGDVSKFIAGNANWKAGDWHKLDAAWDPNGMAIYIDGRLAGQIRHDMPVKLPHKLSGGTMSLNLQDGFNPHVNGRETSYDRLEVCGRKLTDKEIFKNYRLVRKDAKMEMPIAAEQNPPRLVYRCLPDEKTLEVNLDLWSADLKDRANVPASLSLVSRKTGKTACSTDVVFATPDSTVRFPFGDALQEGETYDLVARVPAAKAVSKAELRVPDMSFLKCSAGLDNSVPPPWSPVKDCGDGTFSVLDRTYRFANGILPSSIVCRGEEMLAKAPNFEVDGQPVAWEPFRLHRAGEDCVVLAAKGRVGDLEVRGRADLWFDGFCLLRIRFDPGKTPSRLNSLALSWSVPADAARYLLTPVFRPWTDGRYDGIFGIDEYSTDQFLWTTGVAKGLCWWCESMANWVGEKGRANLHVVRGKVRADITADVIASPVTLTNAISYTMGFQATPVKRHDNSERDRYYSGRSSFGNWTTGGWNLGSGRPAPDNMKNWTSFDPIDPAAFRDYVAKRKAAGIDMLSYGQLSLITTRDEPWDYFNAVWCRMPHCRGSFVDLDKKVVANYACCGHTGAADWHLNNIEKLCRDYPEHAGLYFDISDVKFCNNALHGHGGTDAFGHPFKTSTALATRAYFLRVWKVASRYGKRVHIHAHNKYYPFVHSFAHAVWPGEEQYYAYAQDPENHYLEGITEEAYQSAWNTEIRGMGVYMICQNHRASDYGEFKNCPEKFFGRRAVMASLMPSLLYDFKCLGGDFGKSNGFADTVFRALSKLPLGKATFHGYWYDPHATVSDGCRTALYTWKPGDADVPFMLVVGNTSRKDVATGLRLDWAKAGCAPKALTDVLSGKTRTEAEWAAFELPSHEFLILVPPAFPQSRPGRSISQRPSSL